MKFSISRRIFRMSASAIFAATASLTTAGCASSGFEDTVPQAALTQPSTPTAASGPRETGVYPDLNVAPQVAAEQIDDEERQALVGELSAARNKAGTGAPTGNAQAEAQGLRRLAASHADAKLQEIERGE